MGLTRETEIFPYPFPNKPKAGSGRQYYADGERVMANLYAALRAMGWHGRAAGSHAAENGSSTSTCRLKVYTENGKLGIVNAGDKVMVVDTAGRVWYCASTANDEIEFGRTEQEVEGGGWMDTGYNASGFKDTLTMLAFVVLPVITAPMIAAAADAANPVTAETILLKQAETGTVAERVAGAETALSAEHDGETGVHNAGVIKPTNLSAPDFVTEADENIIWGYFGVDSDLDGVADGWKAYNSPSLLELVDSPTKIGPKSQKVVATQYGDGIEGEVIKPHLTADFAGDPLGLALLIYCTEDDSVKVEVEDNNGTTTSLAGGVTGQFKWLGVVHTAYTTLTSLKFRAYATKATTFYVSVAAVKPGNVQPRYTSNIGETVANVLNATDLSNWFLNSYFDEWTNDWPDWWQTNGAGVTTPTNITDDLADWIYGGRACRMELALGEGIYYDMPGNDCNNFFGDNVYLGIHFKGVSGNGTVRFTLDDGVNTESVDYTFDGAQTEWKRPDVRMKIDPNVTRIRAIIKCVATGGGNIEVLADAIMFSRIYDFPMAPQFVPQSHYTLIPIYFYISQPNVGGPVLMNHQGGAAADVFPVSVDTYIHKIRIFEGTAQGPATTDTFRVLLNGNPTSLTAALTGGTQAGAAHYAPGITFAEGDRLAVDAEATDPTTPTPGQTVGACVEGYVFNK